MNNLKYCKKHDHFYHQGCHECWEEERFQGMILKK